MTAQIELHPKSWTPIQPLGCSSDQAVILLSTMSGQLFPQNLAIFSEIQQALCRISLLPVMAERDSGRSAGHVTVNVINNSSQPVTAGQPKVSIDSMGRMVIDVMIADLKRNGPYVRRLKGAV